MATNERTTPENRDDSGPLVIRRPSARALLAALLGVLGVLVVLDLAAWASGREAAERFSLDGETTVATWWASAQLILLGGLFGLAAVSEARSGRRKAAWTLAVGGFVAIFFSLDETAAFHENITAVLRTRSLLPAFADGHGLWISVYAVLGVVLLIATFPGIVSLLATHRSDTLLIAFGGAIFVVGGVLVEVVGYFMTVHFWVVVEETLEFSGIALMVSTTYRMLASREIRLIVP